MTARTGAVIVGWVLTVLLGVFLLFSGFAVTFGVEHMSEQYALLGLSYWQVIIGLGKIITAILFLIPTTFVVGALFLSALFGGAIVAHMAVGDSIIIQSAFLVLVWVILALRRPDAFFVFKKK